MTSNKSSITIHRNGQRDNFHMGLWQDSWDRLAELGPLRSQIKNLSGFAEAHHERGMAKKIGKGKPQSWQDRLGLKQEDSAAKDVARIRQSLKAARDARKVADAIAERAAGELEGLRPYDDGDTPALAITRASVRQRLATMTDSERRAFCRGHISAQTLKAIFEVEPQMAGFDTMAPELEQIWDAGMQRKHGELLARIEALSGCAAYAQRLAEGVEAAMQAESTELGLKPDEFRDLAARAVAA